ncbi:hypothetical protein M747DRAFT_319655 [Aspergillus niger ATCC 13496]|uniref:Contig An12c0200, genomic contig n=3 Tax=Aspergillus niger TaxID=5061 RepID=A2QZZ0_ASPNC|nr:uncharacterized protein An12g06730 [Aspergillus niger]RDH14285.1 hypothetical protein M747DRAFT_319655 [Aspergillus niger ATCC 13496]CAK41202.1 unnamed protein product [Aspergillus niger]
MNPWSITQGHPFSVVWWHEELRLPTDPSNDEELGREFSILGRDGTATAESIMESMIERPFTFWLLIQPRWGLTKHLAAYGSSTKLRAVVDGPYGGNHDLKEYGHVIMFAQGIGIAAQIPYIRYLLYGSLRGELPVRRISLIWETHSCNLATVSPWMRHLLMEDFDNYTKTLMLNIKLYIPDVHNNEEYGRRVKSFAHRVNIKEVLPKEFQHDRGKILITGLHCPHSEDVSSLMRKSIRSEAIVFIVRPISPLKMSTLSSFGVCTKLSNITSGPLPISDYHKRLHVLAGPSILETFYAVQRNAIESQTAKAAQQQISAINAQIRRQNSDSNVQSELGVIALDIFIYAWSVPGLQYYLYDFCRLQHYPVGWARQPPQLHYVYRPYKSRYWDDCNWSTPKLLFSFVWQLRKAGETPEIIDDQETLILEHGFTFNRRVIKLHLRHGNMNSMVGLIQTDDILQYLKDLAHCLITEDRLSYEKKRDDLRKACILHGYPCLLIPGTYSQETANKK